MDSEQKNQAAKCLESIKVHWGKPEGADFFCEHRGNYWEKLRGCSLWVISHFPSHQINYSFWRMENA